MLHELSHTPGLGGATDPTSHMFETLVPGSIARTVTVADLNIPDPPERADPQTALPLRHVLPSALTFTPSNTSQGLMALDEVIFNWTTASDSMMKRLTAPTAGATVSLDLGRARILPAVNVGTRSSGSPGGDRGRCGREGLDIPPLFAGKGQWYLSQKVKTPGHLTGS